MTVPTTPEGIVTAGEVSAEAVNTTATASQDIMDSFKAHTEAALSSGSILNKLGEDWFVSIGELTQKFRETFDTPGNMKRYEHAELVEALGLEWFQKVIAKIRKMEESGEDPWEEYAAMMTMKVLYEDGTVSARDIQVLEDYSLREKLPETEGIIFEIQPSKEWFWRKVPMADRPDNY